MPVYDFSCKCGNKTTRTISINSKDFTAICVCGEQMQRVYTAPGVSFKGSGYYSTDKNK